MNLSPVVCLAAKEAPSKKDAVWVNSVFQKGKSLYEAGDYKGAVKEWDKLNPYLDQYPSFQKVITYLKSQIRDAKEVPVPSAQAPPVAVIPAGAPSAAPAVPVQADMTPEVSPSVAPALDSAQLELRDKLLRAKEEKKAQELWIETAFQKGKAFYDQGDYENAIAEWDKMASRLDAYPEIRAKVQVLKDAHRKVQEAKLESSDFANTQYTGLKVARKDEMVQALVEADRQLRTKADEMLEQKRTMQKSLEERRDWLNLNFEKGRALFKEGKYREAFDQWRVLAPYLENETEVRAQLARAEEALASYESSVESSRSAIGADRSKAPDGLRRAIEDLVRETAVQTRKLETQRAQAESALEKRDAELIKIFDQGSKLYAEGKIAEAVAQWKKLVPMLEDSNEIAGAIARFEEHHQKSKDLQTRLQAMAADKARFSPPADLSSLIAKADQDLRAQIESATNERLAMEQGMKERDAWVQSTLQKAKAALDAGRTGEAIDEWNKLVSYLDAGSEERAMLERLKKNWFDAEEARKQNKAALERQGIKLQLPEAYGKAIEEANRKALESLNESRIEREAMQRDIVDRQAWVVTTYQKGRALFEAGRMEEALAEWKKLPDHLDPKSNVRASLTQMETALRGAEEARRALAEAQARKAAGHRAPEGLSENAAKAAALLKQEASEAALNRQALEKEFAERQVWLDATFKAGKLYFDQGKTHEATAEWEKLAPYLPESSQASHDLRALKEAQDRSVQAKKEAVEAMAAGHKGIQLPAELPALLRELTKKVEAATIESQRQKNEIQQTLSDKQRTSTITFEKARLFQQNGDLTKAVEQWYSLLPYLAPASAESRQIEALKIQHDEWHRASDALAAARKTASSPVSAPAEMPKLLSEAAGQLKAQAKQAEAKRVQYEKADAARRAGLETNWQKGRSLYIKGDIGGALEQWAAAVPVLDESSAKLVMDAGRAYMDSIEARKAAEMAAARRQAKLSLPAELRLTLEEAVEKFKAATQQALSSKEGAEKARAERQSQLNGVFEKGKLFYQAGDLTDALKVWGSMLPELGDARDQAAIRELDKAHRALQAAQQAAQEAAQRAAQPLPAPEGLPAFLGEIQQAVAAKNQEASLSRARMEKTLSDRQAQAGAAFQSAKTLLAKNQWRDAVAQLDVVAAQLDEKSELRAAIQALKKAAADADAAEKSAAHFAANEYKSLKIPFADELTGLLSQAGGKIQSNILASQKQKADMEKALVEREAWARATFEKGKAFYDKGQYKEALEFWTTLTPYLQNEAAMKALMAGLAQSHQAARDAEKAAADAEARLKAGVSAPADFKKLTDEMAGKLKTLHFEAISRREKALQQASTREAEMLKALHQGTAQMEAGEHGDALKTWSALPQYLHEPGKVKAMLDSLSQAQQSLDEARKAAAEAEARASSPLPPPAEFAQLLGDASRRLDKERQVADLGRERSEKLLAEKQQKLQSIFAEGKKHYDEGRLNAAFLSWRGLLPMVAEEAELEPMLLKAEESYQRYVQTRDQGQAALAKKEAKLAAPAELSRILDEANRMLGDQVFDMKNKTAQTEKMVADRKKWVEVTFLKGKHAYSAGNFKDAAAEWRTLLPFVENGEQLKHAIDDFERGLQVSMDSSKTFAEVQARKDARFPAPEELAVLLTQLNEKVKNEALEATAEKVKAEQVYFERQKAMREAFERGRAHYGEGRIEDALAEWDRLRPYLDGQSGIQKLLDAVKESYRASLDAQKGAVEAAAADYQGLKLPYAEQMAKLLNEADRKLKDEAGRLDTKKREVERTLAERQEWAVTTFNKGKVFFDQGQYKQALDQWERLMPYLSDGSGMKRQLQTLRENYNIIARERAGIGPDPETGAERKVVLKDEATMIAVLNQANDALKAQSEEVRAKADAAQKEIRERSDWIEYTFEQGKKLYDQGQYNKAVEQWGLLGPYLGEHPQVREAIERLKAARNEGEVAKKVIASVEAKKTAMLPLPSGAQKPQTAEDAATQAAAAVDMQNAGQLVSAEIVSVDKPQKTLTVKVLSAAGKDETLTVNFDDQTQVDGSQAELASLASGSNVELRYNPDTSRALYVYVY